MAAQGKVPHDDYDSGFLVGFQAMVGTLPKVPPITSPFEMKEHYTPFLMGVREGIKAGGGNVRG